MNDGFNSYNTKVSDDSPGSNPTKSLLNSESVNSKYIDSIVGQFTTTHNISTRKTSVHYARRRQFLAHLPLRYVGERKFYAEAPFCRWMIEFSITGEL